LAEQSLDDVLEAICSHLKYDQGAAGTLCVRTSKWFEEESIFSLKALLQVCTEAVLGEAKLKVLWVYIKDLQGKTGLAPAVQAKEVLGKKEKREPKPLTEDRLVKRKAECYKEWKEHSGCKKTALQISEDGLKFACTVCSTREELKWRQLRGPSDVRIHCIGGPTSKVGDKTPDRSKHAGNVEKQKTKKKESVPKKRAPTRRKNTDKVTDKKRRC
jgi:hypothetical protein